MLRKLSFTLRSPQDVIKWIVATTGALSLFVALTASLPLIKYLILLLGITPYGVKHLFLWQLITHIFIFPTGGEFSAGYMITLFFNLYFLWVIGIQLSSYMGVRRFLTLFFGSAIASGALVMICLALFPIPYLHAGCQSALTALLLNWTFLNPQMRVLVFLTIPVQARWLIAGLVGINLLTDFANGQFISFISLSSALLYGYFFSLFTFESVGPYTILHKFEKRCLALKERLMKRKRAKKYDPYSKIYDFRTGEPLSNEEKFLDVCVEKVAQHGRKSLSLWEKFRLFLIAKKKRKSYRHD